MLSLPKKWVYSNELLSKIDISPLTREVNYDIKLGEKSIGGFKIEKDAYSKILKASCRYYFLNRASMDIEEKYAGVYARKAGHPDNSVSIHPSAKSFNRNETFKLSSPGGWYDAGDYNKYIVNSGITCYTLLRAYDKYRKLHEGLHLNIPESSNTKADLLDEVEYNLNWMMTMQDPSDGGVYHKLTEKQFCGFIAPEQADAERYVMMKTTAATLDYAAIMAYYSRFIKDQIRQKEILILAKKAYEWAERNPNVFYKQPIDVNTGQYEDEIVEDEWFWASAELFISTNEQKYTKTLKNNFAISGEANWQYVKPLGLFSLAASQNEFTILAQKNLQIIADKFLTSYKKSANGTVIGVNEKDFIWGSNAIAGNQSILLLEVYGFNKNLKLISAAWSNIHYLLGQNPLDFCYVTGFGTKSPMHIHHRISSSDGILTPQPGLLTGGPNLQQQDKKTGVEYYSNLPALSYVDQESSYASNEIAINWNAPLVYLMSFAASTK